MRAQEKGLFLIFRNTWLCAKAFSRARKKKTRKFLFFNRCKFVEVKEREL